MLLDLVHAAQPCALFSPMRLAVSLLLGQELRGVGREADPTWRGAQQAAGPSQNTRIAELPSRQIPLISALTSGAWGLTFSMLHDNLSV